MRGRIAVLATGLAFLAVAPVAAQTTAGATASVTIPEVLYISLTNPAINFGSATQADLDAQVMSAATTSTLTHRGNRAHRIEIEATTASMVNSDVTNPTVKPTTDLQLSVDGGGTWTGVGPLGSAVQLLTASQGRHTANVNYQMLVDYDDAPDTYTLSFNFTIIAN